MIPVEGVDGSKYGVSAKRIIRERPVERNLIDGSKYGVSAKWAILDRPLELKSLESASEMGILDRAISYRQFKK